MRIQLLVFAPAIMVLVIAGCGTTPVSGGTKSLLKTGDNPLPDVQVTVFPEGGGEALGQAITDGTGVFALLDRDSRGPLHLESGSYLFVLESVGAPTELPREYRNRDTTPLRVNWSAGDTLELNVPGLKLL
ncbi:hypothetical protein GC176_22690 [bacterium]|nr:hypothetical protein [bacterium]